MKPDKIYFSIALMIILTIFSWISSCTHQSDITNMPEICAGDVLNIYIAKCSKINSGCHDGTGESDLVFKTIGDIQHSVVPFNPEGSRSYKAIISTRGEQSMPPDQPISQENRSIIRLWIEQGAIDNTGDTTVCPVNKVTVNGSGNNFLNK